MVLLKSENGKGNRTRSPDSNIVPCLVLRIVPDRGERRVLGIDQIAPFDTLLPGGRNSTQSSASWANG